MTGNSSSFWQGRSVFITGHTGFKGSWLSLWLASAGAMVSGYALEPSSSPALFHSARIRELMTASTIGDVRDLDFIKRSMEAAAPEVIFHLAAQPLVLDSYRMPIETYGTNVMGTANVLEAARHIPSLRSVVVVTTDKCYENREWCWGYRENDRLGGNDPYSNSKACAELVTASWRQSFFDPAEHDVHGVAIATARAGNVIGGGDRASCRILPDFIRYAESGQALTVRNPGAVRPWQHVLEPLSGYMMLARCLADDGPRFGGCWNFGPGEKGEWTVGRLVQTAADLWGEELSFKSDPGSGSPRETSFLRLDSSKARLLLGWKPRWSTLRALEHTVAWYRAERDGEDTRTLCLADIEAYQREEDGQWTAGMN